MEQYDELAEILDKNIKENWPQILSDYFKVDISLVETLVDAYNELQPERFSELVHKMPSYEEYSRYKSYEDGQIINPTQEDRNRAYEIEQKILAEIETKSIEKNLVE